MAARVGSGGRQYPTPPSLLDARHYTDPEQYQRELTAIFHQDWMPVCPVADLGEARQYVVWDGAGQSVVIARLDDGTLSAWHNVCQHRGARLVQETGRCPLASFKCPWHGFAYDLEGRVQHVPLREAFDEKELDGLRAPQVRVEEWSGFVWLTFGDSTSLLEHLGELADDLGGYGLGEWEWRYRESWTIHANWKTVIDAFNETWHVPFTHKNTRARGPAVARRRDQADAAALDDGDPGAQVPRPDGRGRGPPRPHAVPLPGVPEHDLQLLPDPRAGVLRLAARPA